LKGYPGLRCQPLSAHCRCYKRQCHHGGSSGRPGAIPGCCRMMAVPQRLCPSISSRLQSLRSLWMPSQTTCPYASVVSLGPSWILTLQCQSHSFVNCQRHSLPWHSSTCTITPSHSSCGRFTLLLCKCVCAYTSFSLPQLEKSWRCRFAMRRSSETTKNTNAKGCSDHFRQPTRTKPTPAGYMLILSMSICLAATLGQLLPTLTGKTGTAQCTLACVKAQMCGTATHAASSTAATWKQPNNTAPSHH
jgi:hypothetical protein